MSLQQPIVVIGGGAAGLMAAGRAGQLGVPVILLEKNQELGRKIALTGNGRCNLSHQGDIAFFMRHYPKNAAFLYSSFHSFFNEDLWLLMESWGVNLKTEADGRIFPVSDRASDVITAFKKYLRQGKVESRLGEQVTEICQEKDEIIGVKTQKGFLKSKHVIIATGGLSYPNTGSTGDGYSWAKSMGHSIIPPRPALVPLNLKDKGITKHLQGLTLSDVEITLLDKDQVLAKESGDLLFTHFGVSGPAVLKLSRGLTDQKPAKEYILSLNVAPFYKEEKLHEIIKDQIQTAPQKQVKNILGLFVPKRFVPVIMEQSKIEVETYNHQLTKSERLILIKTILGIRFQVEGPRSWNEAIVTAGGVDVKEVYPQTMESKIIRGLYFAGEVLDIDGVTGGYNLQAAFSTGYVAGLSAASAWTLNQV